MRLLWLTVPLVVLAAGGAAAEARIKDISAIREARSNQLIGYGLVAGLKATGDSLRSAPFTDQSITSMMERMGVNIRGLGARTRNVAAVMVTAELPPFSSPGNRIDVTVTSMGDASSLAGGTLIMTALQAADGKVYAVAQGSVSVSGFEAKGQNEVVTHGVPTAGRIAGGAMVERSSPSPSPSSGVVHLELKNPDFSTAVLILDAVNSHTQQRYGVRLAQDNGPASVAVQLPKRVSPSRFIAEIGSLQVRPDSPARIIIDERTGTIVISQNVKVSRVAVTHGNLTVRVTDTPSVSQPQPFSKGETVVTVETSVKAAQASGNFAVLDGVDLQALVTGLNRMGLKPPGIIAILQAIKTAGALQAELVVQ